MWTDMENACIKVPFQKQKVLTNHFNLYVFFKKKIKKTYLRYFLLRSLKYFI